MTDPAQDTTDITDYATSDWHPWIDQRQWWANTQYLWQWAPVDSQFGSLPEQGSPERGLALALLSILGAFGCASDVQLRRIFRERAEAAIEAATSSNFLAETISNGPAPRLYKIRSRSILERMYAQMTPAEQIAVCGNVQLVSNSNHMRHDVLGLQLALDIPNRHIDAILGEPWAQGQLLLPDHRGPERGDLVIVHNGGVRDVYEIVGSVSSLSYILPKKFTTWMQALGLATPSVLGMRVIMFCADSSGGAVSARQAIAALRRVAKEPIEGTGGKYLSSEMMRHVLSSILIVKASDWPGWGARPKDAPIIAQRLAWPEEKMETVEDIMTAPYVPQLDTTVADWTETAKNARGLLSWSMIASARSVT